ncbi:MAG: DUF1549 domain-containing protein, partial [Planctomycetia bacterium]|nr:DUF1549 domain-containing protein [Planctomycetia bacterium]
MYRRLVLCSLAAVALPFLFVLADTAPANSKVSPTGKLQYGRDIQPILSAHCFTCHGPDEKTRKGGLRLDIAEEAVKELDSGMRAIVPGKPGESELVKRIHATNREQMPPAKSLLQLKPAEKQMLERWIAEGAVYQRHWAFVPPKRPTLPENLKDAAWTKNAIDRFVLARLEREGLKPSSEADRYTLARRVAIDLIGLPPSPALVEKFINDQQPNAYERYVDSLLELPAYGERWAAVWLDLARYADSNGYANDNPRVIWRFRDWTIEAINANLPYDRFTIEQLAGDLLPNPTKQQILATAFHRNTLSNDEGGTNDEEFRVAAVVDRVNTTMQVWMGLSMACAQCHDHKYDPLSQEEYFKLFAIFNQTEDADRGDNSPLLTELTAEDEQRIAKLKEEIAQLEKVVAEQKQTAAGNDPILPKREGALPTRFVRVELLGKGAYLHLAEVQVFVGEENVARHGKAKQVSTAYDGPARLANDGDTNGDYNGKSVSHTDAADNPWWEVDLGKAQTIDKIIIWNRTDGGTGARLNNWRVIALDDDRKPVWVKSYAQPPNPSTSAALPKTAAALDAAAKAELVKYLKGDTAAKATPEQKKLDDAKKQLAAIKGVGTPIMKELSEKQRRKTNILLRGNFLDKGKEVTPGVPAVLAAQPNAVTNRLELAHWLMSKDNPLTARVTVNRYWEQIFGQGLVETPEDWGIRGKLPMHPELLDWLAVEFMSPSPQPSPAGGEGGMGWDVKKLLK